MAQGYPAMAGKHDEELFNNGRIQISVSEMQRAELITAVTASTSRFTLAANNASAKSVYLLNTT